MNTRKKKEKSQFTCGLLLTEKKPRCLLVDPLLKQFSFMEPIESCENWILFDMNLGENLSIDEASLSQGELQTALGKNDYICYTGIIF